MAIRLGSYSYGPSGSEWTDGEVLFSDDLNDTFNTTIPTFVGSTSVLSFGDSGGTGSEVFSINDKTIHGLYVEYETDSKTSSGGEAIFSVNYDYKNSVGSTVGSSVTVLHKKSQDGGSGNYSDRIVDSTSKYFQTYEIGSDIEVTVELQLNGPSTGDNASGSASIFYY